jgi:hypothetical protein
MVIYLLHLVNKNSATKLYIKLMKFLILCLIILNGEFHFTEAVLFSAHLWSVQRELPSYYIVLNTRNTVHLNPI